MNRSFKLLIISGLSTFLLVACVTTKTHENLKDDFERYKTNSNSYRDTMHATLDRQLKQLDICNGILHNVRGENQTLVQKVRAMGEDVEQLLGEKGLLNQEHLDLTREVAELKRMRIVADARDKEFRVILKKLKSMIDSDTLRVKIRNGRMLVEMASDVVFAAGRTQIKKKAMESLVELAASLRTLKGRKFLVVGHSDNTPIQNNRFSSNWQLSAQRAIEVVMVMIKNGVDAKTISAAAQAEFDPLQSNNTPEGREANRRVEIVFLPTVEELPGLDKLLEKKELEKGEPLLDGEQLLEKNEP